MSALQRISVKTGVRRRPTPEHCTRWIGTPQFGEGTTTIRAIMPPSSCSMMWQW